MKTNGHYMFTTQNPRFFFSENFLVLFVMAILKNNIYSN